MKVLWREGACNVRKILEVLNEEREEDYAYTTVLRFVQIMMGKELLERYEEGRGHVYVAALPEDETKGGLVKDLLDRAFGGSSKSLVLNMLGTGDPGTLREIQEALAELQSEQEEGE